MEKKHTNRFSIVFNEIDLQQLFAINKLNSLPPRRLAVYISQAIYAYENGVRAPTLTTEKRKRGRPPKKKPIEADLPAHSSDSSSHHIYKVQSEKKHDESVGLDNESKGPAPINNAMLQSMMNFVDT